ncbi:MAG: sulfatase [Aureliella sp.]
MTGLYPHNTGAGELHLPLPAEKELVTTPLRKAGYWTAAVGKWHLGEAVANQVDYRQGSRPEKMGDAWETALRNRPMDKPFFLWAAHSDPHRAYKPGAVEPPHAPESAIVPEFLPDTPIVRKDLALYYDEVSRFDQHVGQALEVLREQDAIDNTVVIVMSDNGRPFPHCKTRVTVPGVRTPFVISWPEKIQKGEQVSSVVSSVDLAPTVLSLAGLEPSEAMQGVNFASTIRGNRDRTRLYAFAEHNWHDYRAFERGVHSKKYCYVRNWLPGTPGTPPADAVKSITYDEMKRLLAVGELTPEQAECFLSPREEEFLFDVEADPNCVHNLVDAASKDEQLAKELSRLRDALARWQKATDDHFRGEEQLTPDGFDRNSGDRIISASHPSKVKKP